MQFEQTIIHLINKKHQCLFDVQVEQDIKPHKNTWLKHVIRNGLDVYKKIELSSIVIYRVHLTYAKTATI